MDGHIKNTSRWSSASELPVIFHGEFQQESSNSGRHSGSGSGSDCEEVSIINPLSDDNPLSLAKMVAYTSADFERDLRAWEKFRNGRAWRILYPMRRAIEWDMNGRDEAGLDRYGLDVVTNRLFLWVKERISHNKERRTWCLTYQEEEWYRLRALVALENGGQPKSDIEDYLKRRWWNKRPVFNNFEKMYRIRERDYSLLGMWYHECFVARVANPEAYPRIADEDENFPDDIIIRSLTMLHKAELEHPVFNSTVSAKVHAFDDAEAGRLLESRVEWDLQLNHQSLLDVFYDIADEVHIALIKLEKEAGIELEGLPWI